MFIKIKDILVVSLFILDTPFFTHKQSISRTFVLNLHFNVFLFSSFSPIADYQPATIEQRVGFESLLLQRILVSMSAAAI